MIAPPAELSTRILPLAAYLLAGWSLGALYFLGLWENTRLLVSGRRRAALLLMAGRLVLLALALALISRQGAWSLLAAALGLLPGRSFMLRRYGRVAP
jgi:F1F0 ATPase subunit 2